MLKQTIKELKESRKSNKGKALKKILKKLKGMEKELTLKLGKIEDAAKRKKIEDKISVIKKQRKKGLKALRAMDVE